MKKRIIPDEILVKMMESIASFLYHSSDGDSKKLVRERLNLVLSSENDSDGIKLAIFCKAYNNIMSK
jgi:hypothetical protein